WRTRGSPSGTLRALYCKHSRLTFSSRTRRKRPGTRLSKKLLAQVARAICASVSTRRSKGGQVGLATTSRSRILGERSKYPAPRCRTCAASVMTVQGDQSACEMPPTAHLAQSILVTSDRCLLNLSFFAVVVNQVATPRAAVTLELEVHVRDHVQHPGAAQRLAIELGEFLKALLADVFSKTRALEAAVFGETRHPIIGLVVVDRHRVARIELLNVEAV